VRHARYEARGASDLDDHRPRRARSAGRRARILRLAVVAVLVLLGAVPSAADEPFPSRTITIVNPYPPGGQADLSGRPFAAALAKVLKQPVIIANKPGAAGAVSMQSVAVAKPDDYTLIITVPSLHTLFAPKATPPPIIKVLRDATRQAVEDPTFRTALEKLSSPAAYQGADEFKPWLDADAAPGRRHQEDREGRVNPVVSAVSTERRRP
jgi:tripartite-type tricarboxylate transporter receptor subunit TctC